jgi:hypothetical protein
MGMKCPFYDHISNLNLGLGLGSWFLGVVWLFLSFVLVPLLYFLEGGLSL